MCWTQLPRHALVPKAACQAQRKHSPLRIKKQISGRTTSTSVWRRLPKRNQRRRSKTGRRNWQRRLPKKKKTKLRNNQPKRNKPRRKRFQEGAACVGRSYQDVHWCQRRRVKRRESTHLCASRSK